MCKQDSVDKVKQKKRDLDIINYGKELKKGADWNINNDNRPELEKPIYSNIIKNEYEKIIDIISNKKGYHIGAISSGTHSIDYANIYGFDINDDEWNRTPVMFVFENPSNNVDACFAGNPEEAIKCQNSNDDEDWKQLLSKYIWHADYGYEDYKKHSGEYGNGKFRFFESMGKYSELLLSIILEFKLANFYTTNIFRYEIFTQTDKKDEAYCNIDSVKKDILKEEFDICGDDSSFMKELDVFDPSIIFATSKPYGYLKDYCKEENKTIVKVPHPSGQFAKENRFICNAMAIINGLHKAGVIGDDLREKRIEKAIEKYYELI